MNKRNISCNFKILRFSKVSRKLIGLIKSLIEMYSQTEQMKHFGWTERNIALDDHQVSMGWQLLTIVFRPPLQYLCYS